MEGILHQVREHETTNHLSVSNSSVSLHDKGKRGHPCFREMRAECPDDKVTCLGSQQRNEWPCIQGFRWLKFCSPLWGKLLAWPQSNHAGLFRQACLTTALHFDLPLPPVQSHWEMHDYTHFIQMEMMARDAGDAELGPENLGNSSIVGCTSLDKVQGIKLLCWWLTLPWEVCTAPSTVGPGSWLGPQME